MIPKNITKEHVLQAIADIRENGLRYPLGKSSIYDLSYENKKYPPKHVIVIANEFANGELLAHDQFTTSMAQRFLLLLGAEFMIEKRTNDPVQQMIEGYKEDLVEKGLNDELYKWRMLKDIGGKPDLSGLDFAEKIRTITYDNLIFHTTRGVRNHILAENPQAYREALEVLFNENLLLGERINLFQAMIDEAYRAMGQTLFHHQDERAIATFLTVKYPEKYTFYKSSFYVKYCIKLGEKTKKKNEKYIHYLKLVEDLVERYIKPDSELLEIVSEKLPPGLFQDQHHKLLAQDILYKMLDKNEVTFKSVIGDLQSAMQEEESILKDFSIDYAHLKDNGFSGRKDSYVWIRDAAGLIGNRDAHFEVSIRTRNAYKNCFFVDIHFEGKQAQKFKTLIGNELPEGLEWIPWQDGHSIGTKTGLNPFDEDVVDQITEQLLFLENSIADRVRYVMPLDPEKVSEKNNFEKMELNQILYGPPGTGKTYHTIDRALKIIDPVFYAANRNDRHALTRQFRDLLISDFDNGKGQIAFCTFHQSMSYEDFIEGIKPVSPKGTEGAVNYQVTDGLFKKICLQASKTKSVSGFDDSYDKFVNEVVENENVLVLYTPKLKKPFNIRINSNHNVVAIPQTENATEMVVTRSMVMNYMTNGIVDDWKSYTIAISEHIQAHYPFQVTDEDNTKKNFVLIIDEINRGNISQIFGELITLIEDSKRKDADEELRIILPYSAHAFSVPRNLYIIGTMNTADRSVEALDTALRRRFSFEEMPSRAELLDSRRLIWQLWWAYEDKPWNDPKFLEKETPLYHFLGASELEEMNEDKKEEIWNKMKYAGADERIFGENFNGFNLKVFLMSINARLEKLLSADHVIGHSYFMSIYSMEDLRHVIYNKVIPLLQEYFYGDLSKIGPVLGAGFIREKKLGGGEVFAQFDFDPDELDGKAVYEILDYRVKETFEIDLDGKKHIINFEGALDLLLGKKLSSYA
ncbi:MULTISPECIES: McrB family protein [Pedobacter]|uniref:AAA domain (Dynein-related subfamily) n=1 Tax=Pedobacter soli TaxID=390242 RepID=A0A1G6K4F4_9SPHI|nr:MULTISPECIES: AAA family ATPase [Pedobacter]SDC25844.1 AAA domain (dynein-related subfamily) [Pedobacter soli]